MAGLLYAKQCPINENISVCIPSVGEILDDEENFFEIVSTVVATPYDMMVPLDDAGIDFTKLTDFDLFMLMVGNLQNRDVSLLFGDLSFDSFAPAINKETKEMVLVDMERDIVIDRVIHRDIANMVRKILSLERNEKKAGNEEARKYMIERARIKQKRRAKKTDKYKSQVEDIIISLVNAEEFPYNYQTVRDITIYQLYSSLNQISHTIHFDNTMIGYYAGTVKIEDLKPEDRTWLRT